MNKRSKILNRELSACITKLMHGDLIVIADAGLPVPAGVKVLDLAVTSGVPNLDHLLPLFKDEVVLERVIVAAEMKKVNLERFTLVNELFGGMKSSGGENLVEVIPHDEIESLLPTAKLIIQTGEISPYGNVLMVGGIDFFSVGMAA